MTVAPDVFADRRERFAEALRGGVAVIAGGRETIRNRDVHYEFRQDSDFWFLTGFEEPDAVAVIDPGHPTDRFVLFVRPRDPELELWNGRRAGVDGARDLYGADAAYPIADLDAELARRMVGRDAVYTPLGQTAFAARVTRLANKVRGIGTRFGRPVPTEIRDAAPLLHELRLRKTLEEVTVLAEACRISALGHVEAMRFTRPGLFEYQIQAAVEYSFRLHGSLRNGYPSIVASGPNACVLHYTDNRRRVGDGDLVLIDAAAEFEFFSADITRTFPASGRFSPPQRAVYDVVLAAQESALASSRPGSTMKDVHDAAVVTIADGLVTLGLLPGPVDRVLSMHHYREFYMHGTGHWLGHDVHDAGSYGIDGKPRRLEIGMSFTVEPGIYISPDTASIKLPLLEYDPEEWRERRMMMGTAAAKKLEAEARDAAGYEEFAVPEALLGIGVRIEDDIVITDDGYENLTGSLPSDPDAVEALCAEAPTLPILG